MTYIPTDFFSGLIIKETKAALVVVLSFLFCVLFLAFISSKLSESNEVNKINVFCSGNKLELKEALLVSRQDRIFKIETVNKLTNKEESWIIDFDGSRIKDAYKVYD